MIRCKSEKEFERFISERKSFGKTVHNHNTLGCQKYTPIKY